MKNRNEIKSLVAYFSCSGTTRKAANGLAVLLGADLYEIKPEVPYSSADLNWNDRASRSSREMRDPASRPAIAGEFVNMVKYDRVFIGFPVWWYIAPTIVNTFLESFDFSGKILIPFATSGGSGIESCEKSLMQTYPLLNWRAGKLLNGHLSESKVNEWLENLPPL